MPENKEKEEVKPAVNSFKFRDIKVSLAIKNKELQLLVGVSKDQNITGRQQDQINDLLAIFQQNENINKCDIDIYNTKIIIRSTLAVLSCLELAAKSNDLTSSIETNVPHLFKKETDSFATLLGIARKSAEELTPKNAPSAPGKTFAKRGPSSFVPPLNFSRIGGYAGKVEAIKEEGGPNLNR